MRSWIRNNYDPSCRKENSRQTRAHRNNFKIFLDQTEELTEEERKLVLQGREQIQEGDYVEWSAVTPTL